MASRIASPVSDISRDVNEDLVSTTLNAPTASPISRAPIPETLTPNTRGSLLDADLGGPRRTAGNITTRRTVLSLDTQADATAQLPSLEDQLAQLRFNAAAADLQAESEAKQAEFAARKAAALEAEATSQRNIKRLALETHDLEHQFSNSEGSRSRSSSGSPPRHPSVTHDPVTTRADSPPSPLPLLLESQAFPAIFLHIETQRREDQRQREADRREDLRRADERAERMEELQRAQWAAFSAATQPSVVPGGRRSTYQMGQALIAFPTFAGDGTQDYDAYIREFEGLVGPHGHDIAPTFWPNELFLKLTGLAKSWYNTTFPATGPLATWSELTLGMQRLFGRKYAAAEAWQQLGTSTRQANETGPAALQRIQELLRALTLLRVPTNPGPNERMCYTLQAHLTAEERGRWMAAANATTEVSDDAIHAKEDAAVAALAQSRRVSATSVSIPIEERDQWFLPRLHHLETFLRDQTAPASRGQAARAAVSQAPEDASLAAPPPGGTRDAPVEREARVRQLRASWAARSERDGPPPLYHGPNSAHLAANTATFAERKTTQACFGCTITQLAKAPAGQPHWLCQHHGVDASEESKKQRVPGSGRGHRPH